MSSPIPPFPEPILVEDGRAWLPVSIAPGYFVLTHLHAGCGLGWAPFGGADLILLNVTGGGDPESKPERYESVAFTISRCGLRALISDLQLIEQQLDPVDRP